MIVGHIGAGSSSVDTGDIQKSLRFRASASAYLSRTPTVAGNRKTWTWSGWVKRGATGAIMCLFSSAANAPNQFVCQFSTGNALEIVDYRGGVTQTSKISSALFRDPSSHYHIVLQVDTTQAVAEDRFKIFVNGTRLTAFSTNTVNTLQNADLDLNQSGTPHRIGDSVFGGGTFDGYLSRICFVDGQALTPDSFGYFNTEINEWVSKSQATCKAVVDAGGTNSFMLDFDNGTSLTTLGYDKSSKGNNWTLNNHSLTAGVNYDWMEDVPGNSFAVLNPLASVTPTLVTNSNLAGNNTTTGNYSGYIGSIAMPSGKWYYEGTTVGAAPTTMCGVGITTIQYYAGTSQPYAASVQSAPITYLQEAGTASGNVVGVAYDADAGTCQFYLNGVAQGSLITGLTGTRYPIFLVSYYGSTQVLHANFGQRPFAYSPPAGFKALCTKNLPTPSITNPKKHFDVKQHTGGASVSQDITGLLFSPDLAWVKARGPNARHHALFDTVRGANAGLYSSLTYAETLWSGQSFLADGFRVDRTFSGETNSTGDTYVDWLWKAGGAPVTNNAGSIQSQVSANPQAGFSIVTYTGTGANATVGHGLGVAPSFIIQKYRGGLSNWHCYHVSLGASYNIALNTTAAADSYVAYWNSTSPTSSVFSLGTSDETNKSGGACVAYCFAEIPGYSKIGSYTGNGSADGPFVYCGFRPKFVLWKNASVVSNWAIEDTSRSTYNQMQDYLLPNLSAAEGNASTVSFDFTANGFKVRGADSGLNGSGNTFIFIAFAEAPFQFANAR